MSRYYPPSADDVCLTRTGISQGRQSLTWLAAVFLAKRNFGETKHAVVKQSCRRIAIHGRPAGTVD